MKYLLSVVLILTIVSSSCVVMASEIDFNAYSDAEIVELLSRIQTEVAKRNIEKTANLPTGTYTIGKDIPAGRYLLTGTYTGDWWASIYVYSAEEIKKEEDRDAKYDITIFEKYGEVTNSVSLEDGDVLIVKGNGVKVSLTISAGVVFK